MKAMWTQGLTPNQEAIPKKGKIRFLQWSISGYINHTPGQDPMTRRNWLIQIDSMHFKHFVLFWYYCCLIDFLFFHCFFLCFGRLGGRFFTCFFFSLRKIDNRILMRREIRRILVKLRKGKDYKQTILHKN